jgi:hypothetical protein
MGPRTLPRGAVIAPKMSEAAMAIIARARNIPRGLGPSVADELTASPHTLRYSFVLD